MLPHLIRAQGAYKGIQVHTFITFQDTHTHHTHRHTKTNTHRDIHVYTQSLAYRQTAHIHTYPHASVHARSLHTTNACILVMGLVENIRKKTAHT